MTELRFRAAERLLERGWACERLGGLGAGSRDGDGVLLKVACSEATIALGDAAAAATYLSAGFRPDFLVSTQVGAALGAFLGARVAAFVKARVVRLVVLGVLLFAAVNLLAP
jgi:uncharacterized membrane protein YfcA